MADHRTINVPPYSDNLKDIHYYAFLFWKDFPLCFKL
jgi:hypothetical protein